MPVEFSPYGTGCIFLRASSRFIAFSRACARRSSAAWLLDEAVTLSFTVGAGESGKPIGIGRSFIPVSDRLTGEIDCRDVWDGLVEDEDGLFGLVGRALTDVEGVLSLLDGNIAFGGDGL